MDDAVQTMGWETTYIKAVHNILCNNDRDRDIKKTRCERSVLWSAPRKYTEYNCLVGNSYDNISPTYRGVSIIDAITIEEKKVVPPPLQ